MKGHLNSQMAEWGSAWRRMARCMTLQSMRLRRYHSAFPSEYLSVCCQTLQWTDRASFLRSVTHRSRTCVKTWVTCREWMNVESCTLSSVELKPACHLHMPDPTWSISGLRYRPTTRWTQKLCPAPFGGFSGLIHTTTHTHRSAIWGKKKGFISKLSTLAPSKKWKSTIPKTHELHEFL